MATRKSSSKRTSSYGTVKIENDTNMVMLVYVTDPSGKEHYLNRLGPGESIVQFTPVGVTWKMKPEVEAMEFVAEEEENIFTLTKGPDKSRGGSLTTSMSADGSEEPEKSRGGSLTT